MELVLLMVVTGLEKFPGPLVLTPATLTVYCVPDSSPLNETVVLSSPFTFTTSTTLPLLDNNSSTLHPVGGAVVRVTMAAPCRGRGHVTW